MRTETGETERTLPYNCSGSGLSHARLLCMCAHSGLRHARLQDPCACQDAGSHPNTRKLKQGDCESQASLSFPVRPCLKMTNRGAQRELYMWARPSPHRGLLYSRLISFQAKAATRMISFTYLYPHHLRALFCFLLRKVTQAGLKFIILQPQPSCCWNDRFTTIPSVILPSDSHCQPWSRHTLNAFLLLLVSTPWPPMHVALVACQAFRSAHITQPSGLLMVL